MITEHDIKQSIAQFTKQPIDNISNEKPIANLVADSFMLVELMLTLQEQYNVHFDQQELEQVKSTGQLVTNIINKHFGEERSIA